jgi:hypothetical protein
MTAVALADARAQMAEEALSLSVRSTCAAPW